MIVAKGICGTCGQGVHLTKHYGWQHDKPNKEFDKEHFALSEANINKVATEGIRVKEDRDMDINEAKKTTGLKDYKCPICSRYHVHQSLMWYEHHPKVLPRKGLGKLAGRFVQ